MLKRVLVAFLAIAAVSPLFGATFSVAIGPGRIYTPSSVTVAPGDTVTWTFNEAFHSTTSDSQVGPEVWDSGVARTSGTTFSHTFNTPGTYPYYCTIHSVPGGTAMNGVVNVIVPAPTITSVVPTSGPTTGGTSATVNGNNFDATCGVTFGGLTAVTGTITPTTIAVTTPAHAAGAVSVNVACSGGNASLSNAFTYVAPAPSITSVVPSTGPTAGGTSVAINGSNFDASCGVTFGGIAVTPSNIAANAISLTTPPHAAGAVAVSVACSGGNASLTNAFTYVAPVPSVTSVVPTSGPAAGGTSATVNGTNFDSSCSVTFGGIAATTGTITSTTIAVTTPAHAPGAVSVGVSCTAGAASLANAYTYLGAAPVITSVQPQSAAPGATVTISGMNFVAGAVVQFASTSSLQVTFVDSSTLTAVVPNLAPGPARVTVTNPDLQFAIYDGFTVLGASAIPLNSPWLLLVLGCALAIAAATKLR